VHSTAFTLEVPWETPISSFLGRHLSGMNIGLRTELQIARAIDPGDLDPVNVHPLPAQQAILDAFGALGFRFKHADLEDGRIRNTRQRLPFYQEIEFRAPQQYRGLKEVELSFVSDGREMDVVMEMDKKPGVFTGRDSESFRSFTVGHDSFQNTNWAEYLDHWLTQVGGQINWF
jgi:sporulation-control protein